MMRFAIARLLRKIARWLEGGEGYYVGGNGSVWSYVPRSRIVKTSGTWSAGCLMNETSGTWQSDCPLTLTLEKTPQGHK